MHCKRKSIQNLYKGLAPHGRLRFLPLPALLKGVGDFEISPQQVFLPDLVNTDLKG